MTVRRAGLPVTYKGLRSGTISLAGNVVIAVSAVAPAYSLAATLAAIVAVAGTKAPALLIVGRVASQDVEEISARFWDTNREDRALPRASVS